jgi:hypothetical protein
MRPAGDYETIKEKRQNLMGVLSDAPNSQGPNLVYSLFFDNAYLLEEDSPGVFGGDFQLISHFGFRN